MKQSSRGSSDLNNYVGKDIMTQPAVNFTNLLNPRALVSYPAELQTSFQNDMGETHSQEIWKASIVYLKAALTQNFNEEKGLNSQEIFSSLFDNSEAPEQEETAANLIFKNPIFEKNETRSQFLMDLRAQPNLQKFLNHLSKLFQEDIFHQICIFIYESWELYLRNKDKYTMSKQLSDLKMNGCKNLDQAEDKPNKKIYLPLNPEEIQCLAKQASEEISSIYFIDSRIKFINLKECEKTKKPQRTVREQFENFLYSLINCVFLCLEGEFYSPQACEKQLPRGIMKEFSSDFPSSEFESELMLGVPTKKREMH